MTAGFVSSIATEATVSHVGRSRLASVRDDGGGCRFEGAYLFVQPACAKPEKDTITKDRLGVSILGGAGSELFRGAGYNQSKPDTCLSNTFTADWTKNQKWKKGNRTR
ncbi:hypothetical protein CWB98_00965 [Pseudoalteromonas rubra]|uniref:Uncharacterized protein n=1 Tax=Pseudoalteromonas rubra TaxID=43658 RepID=A0A5S3X5W1_9GAMM|nr:hypothetical protein CWB98_00965 [Pseudoalteromonas rubra]